MGKQVDESSLGKVSDTKTCWGELSICGVVLGGHSHSCSGGICRASNGRLDPLLYLYTYTLGAVLRYKTSVDLSPLLFALVVGAGLKLKIRWLRFHQLRI